MKNYKVIFIISLFGFFTTISCKKDDGNSCTTCSSSQTQEFTLCEESNGNASVNGQDTGTDYDVYVQGLEGTGTTCGE